MNKNENSMKKSILTIILVLAALTTTAQNRLIKITDESEAWRKTNRQAAFYDSEKARLLMPTGAAFGVESIPSFSQEWTLAYDSISHTLVYKEAETSIWHTTYQAMHKKKKVGEKRYKWVPRKRPKDYEAPDVKTFAMAVTNDQTAMLSAIWTSAISTAEDREDGMLDGVRWTYFINDQRAKCLSIDKHPLVDFTNALVNAVRNGDAIQADSLIGTEFQRVVAGLRTK